MLLTSDGTDLNAKFNYVNSQIALLSSEEPRNSVPNSEYSLVNNYFRMRIDPGDTDVPKKRSEYGKLLIQEFTNFRDVIGTMRDSKMSKISIDYKNMILPG